MNTQPHISQIRPAAILSKSAAYTLVTADYGSTVNVTAAATITLPDAATNPGWWGKIRHGGGDATVLAAGSDTIEFGRDAALTSILLSTQGDEIELTSTGSGWLATGTLHVFAEGYRDPSVDGAQTITTGTNTKVIFGNVNDDTHAAWDTTNSWFTCPFAGEYFIDAKVSFETEAIAYHADLYLTYDTGSAFTIAAITRHIAIDDAYLDHITVEASGFQTCNKGDKLYCKVWHNRGSDVNIAHTSSTSASNIFSVRRVGG